MLERRELYDDENFIEILKYLQTINKKIAELNYNYCISQSEYHLNKIKDLLIGLNKHMVDYLHLDASNEDYFIYKLSDIDSLATTYKKQFLLIHKGLMKSLFSLFEIIYLRSKFILVKILY